MLSRSLSLALSVLFFTTPASLSFLVLPSSSARGSIRPPATITAMAKGLQSDNDKHDALNEPSRQPNAVPLSTPRFDVTGKNFIVTGGTQGLGRTITEQLFAAGARGVVVANRGPKEHPDTEESLAAMTERAKKAGGGKLAYIPFDVMEAARARDFVSRAEAELDGGIHGLVNAAGQNSRGDLTGSEVQLWDAVMNVNARGPFFLMQAVGDAMKAKKIRGSIVSISSVMAHGGMPDTSVYTVSKAALDAVTKVAANQLGKSQIRVNAIHLGPCVTWNEHTLQSELQGEEWVDKGDKANPFGRMVRMVDVASVVGHLLSDAAMMVTDTLVEMHPDLVVGCVTNSYPFGDE